MALKAKIGETAFSVGDLVKVHQKIIEGGKERTQIFEGLVIGIKGREENKSFTVRRIATGNIGVERIWPLNSPWVLKLEVIKRSKVRRAKLYYLRERIGKRAAKIKTREEKPVLKPKKAKKTSKKKSDLSKKEASKK